MMKPNRHGYLDILRGLAVIWMIIFHASYDLKILGLVNWDFSQGFWYAFPRFIAFTFLYCVGISLHLTHSPQINLPNFKKRTLKLALASFGVSLASYLFNPGQWIYFGTLHCILAGSLLGMLFIGKKRLIILFMLAIIYLQYVQGFDIRWVSQTIQKPSLDFIPIYPWFWVILAGMFSAPYLSKNRQICDIKVPHFLSFLSVNSLKIYLIHQPFIFGTLWLVKALI
jgi:uncharacterized membrane protein